MLELISLNACSTSVIAGDLTSGEKAIDHSWAWATPCAGDAAQMFGMDGSGALGDKGGGVRRPRHPPHFETERYSICKVGIRPRAGQSPQDSGHVVHGERHAFC